MSDVTGLGVVELAMLEALERRGAVKPKRHVKSLTILEDVEEAIGLGLGYSYPVLCDMASPWIVNVPCLEGGYFGSAWLDAEPAGPRYTAVRVSSVGALALAAEHGRGGALPLGLINGDLYCRGRRPPFHPRRLVDALLGALRMPSMSDAELVGVVGPPHFPTGCLVSGDFDDLAAGRATELLLYPRVETTRTDGETWLVDRFPPFTSLQETLDSLSSLANDRPWMTERPWLARRVRLPISNIDSVVEEGEDEEVLAVTAERGADASTLAEGLEGLGSRTAEACLPAPLPDLLRSWLDRHAGGELKASLTKLRRLVVRSERPARDASPRVVTPVQGVTTTLYRYSDDR